MKSKFFCFLFFSGTVNTNPHIVCPLYSSAPCQAFHRDVLRHLWAGGPAPGRAGKGGSERGGPAPGGSVGEGQPGQHVSAQTSFLQARELSPWLWALQAQLFWPTFAIKHFVFGMSGVQEKCLLGAFTAFLTVKRAQGPVVSSLRRRL